ncbi:efflux RND transporter permease subunit [Perlabentimonas gracilis]|uniref:efflux RND transporter permease subunit n=1 Tax=Perlabentimonas gracilis TaxID=2715279 RepID=UPI00140E2967|nr:MMPL family transporter [Perlabentimonas gracilis]NHB69887.1 MMPL family transporter [Perlabentimonas gracilis]
MTKIEKNYKLLSWAIMIAVVVLTVFFVRSMRQNARMETNLDEYMPKTHPAFVYSDKAEEWFNIKDGILIAIETKNGIYNPQTLQKIKDISLDLIDMDEFEENDVMSLYTADNIVGSEYGMDVKAFYSRVPKTDDKLEEMRQNVQTNDMVYGRLVSTDGTTALVVAGMKSGTFTPEFYNQIVKFAKSFESDEERIYIAGRPIVEGTMALLGPADMKRMVPIVIVVIGLVLFLLLRSVRATAATLISVFVSSIWAFGMMAVLKVPIYSVSTMIPVMLIAIGVAYGIYYYNHLNRYYIDNPETKKEDAVKYAVRILFAPLSMAAFTTIIGFISLLSSQVYPIKYFGIFTAVGIFTAFLLALLFLPAMVIAFGYKPKVKKTDVKKVAKGRAFRFLSNKLLLNRWWVYGTVWILIIIALVGIQKVWINSSFLDKFEKDSDIVLTDRFVNSKFGGTSTLNVILESDQENAFKQPENLMLIDQMQAETEKLALVGNSFSLADYIKRMNKVMNADNEEFYDIPENNEMVAQYLLLYEMSGDPENLTKLINYDYNRTNITFQLKGDDSKTINEALAVVKQFEDKLNAQGITVNYAGSGYKALVFSDLILEGQVMSIIISLGMVLILLTLMFRSIKAGLIGSVPILITAVLSFGVMGLLNIPLSTTTALLSSIAIGIGIDYAIHFLQYYKMNLAHSRLKVTAIYKTMNQTGKAILFNAVVVISGFMVLLFSVFPPNRTLGALVSMNMFTSLLGTLTVMMILVFTFNVFVKKRKSKLRGRKKY